MPNGSSNCSGNENQIGAQANEEANKVAIWLVQTAHHDPVTL